jgi:site-specific recombinase XerD
MQSATQQKQLRQEVRFDRLVLQSAAEVWATATTDQTSPRLPDMLRDKKSAVLAFFEHSGRSPEAATPADVSDWQHHLEQSGLAPNTIYSRVSRLSSFYSWLMKEPALSAYIKTNPVVLARPKAPKPYQTDSPKALTDEELDSLLRIVRAKADGGDVIARRDYALLLFYVMTGMRRNEIINLRGSDVIEHNEGLVIASKVKGGDYKAREVLDSAVKVALHEYLEASGRSEVLGTQAPVWTRHDRAGRSGAPLSSRAFVNNLKTYAAEAGIEGMHLHRTRHTFGRIIAEETGSLTDVQDALDHRHTGTTRVYVRQISIKKDKFSGHIRRRVNLGRGG